VDAEPSAGGDSLLWPATTTDHRGILTPAEGGSTVATQTVKWFTDAQGYGFIAPNGDDERFVRFSASQGSGFPSRTEGHEVQFDVVEEPRGT
jgi:CspA family cold shock protein